MSYGSDVTCIFARNRPHWSKIHQTQLTASKKCIWLATDQAEMVWALF